MIISIRVKNFFSIREDAIIDFTADRISRASLEGLTENLIEYEKDKFVNIIGLFGSNAAGKSNIIKAIAFCRHLILTSHLNHEDDVLDFEPFKFAGDVPSEFYVEFVTDGIEYTYEFHIFKGKIIFEELYHYPKKRKARVFTRENGSIYSHRKGLIARPAEVETNTGSKTLFLSRASAMNRGIALDVYRFFKNDVVIGTDHLDYSLISSEEIEKNKQILLAALEVSDSDIVDIRVSEINSGLPKLYSFHRENPSIPFDFEKEESEGTKRLLMILLLLLKKSMSGATVFLDEFDLKLHLRLAEFLLDVIRSSRGGQLLFTSHNPWLIDTSKLRYEQIVFVTKREDGNSEFVPLSDFDELSRVPDIRQAYLQGRFDGVPYTGDVKIMLSDLLDKDASEKK